MTKSKEFEVGDLVEIRRGTRTGQIGYITDTDKSEFSEEAVKVRVEDQELWYANDEIDGI